MIRNKPDNSASEMESLCLFFDNADIDECSSNPCLHGQCLNGNANFICSCEEGWTGTLCDHGKPPSNQNLKCV